MNLSIPKAVIRDGNTPLIVVSFARAIQDHGKDTHGHTQFTMMFNGASFDAWILLKWMHAAFEGPSASTALAAFH